ncbi:MAG: hypothetical protein LBQ60_15515 [Bacteroidales bacterium]|jgi:hypothetical protein|nr:hypothetical protein [Bacteroidales bacterium]
MQVNKEHIDELFARKLGNMEISPPEDAWHRIEKDLNYRNQNTRRFWLAAASIALILGAFASVIYLQGDKITPEVKTVTSILNDRVEQEVINDDLSLPPSDLPSDKYDPSTAVAIQNSQNESTDNPSQKADIDVAETSPQDYVEQESPLNQDPVSIPLDQKIDTKKTPVYFDYQNEVAYMQPIRTKKLELLSRKPPVVNKSSSLPKEVPTVASASTNIPIYDMPYFNNDHIDISPKTDDRWEVTGQFAPMYSYRAITGLPDNLSKSDFDDAESALLAYSGGVKVAYKVKNRFSIQTGVYYTQMGQAINHVTPAYNMYAAISSNNSYSKNFVRTSSGNATVTSGMKANVNDNYANYFNGDEATPNSTTNTVANATLSNTSPTKYRMIERLDYIEIPVILRYKLIDRKISFSISGGMSANILIDNNVFIDNGSELIKDGTILMARPVNYNGSVGIGMSYQITKKLLIGIEPMFKYYLQSYTTNNSIDSHPYALGVYFGTVYQF